MAEQAVPPFVYDSSFMKFFLKKSVKPFLGSNGAYVAFDKVGPQNNRVGLIALADDHPHAADLEKAVKDGNVGTWVSISEQEFNEIKKKKESLPPTRSSDGFTPQGQYRPFNPNQNPFGAPAAEAVANPPPEVQHVPKQDLPQRRRPRVGRPRPDTTQ